MLWLMVIAKIIYAGCCRHFFDLKYIKGIIELPIMLIIPNTMNIIYSY